MFEPGISQKIFSIWLCRSAYLIADTQQDLCDFDVDERVIFWRSFLHFLQIIMVIQGSVEHTFLFTLDRQNSNNQSHAAENIYWNSIVNVQREVSISSIVKILIRLFKHWTKGLFNLHVRKSDVSELMRMGSLWSLVWDLKHTPLSLAYLVFGLWRRRTSICVGC